MTDHDALAAILEANPTLSWRGWWNSRDERTYPPEALAEFRRETLASDGRSGLGQFQRAMAFIAVAPRIKSVNRRHSCYGWKHRAQAMFRGAAEGRYADYYVGEGAFIAAAIASGLTIYRGDYATFTNLREKAWSLPDRIVS